MAQPGSGEAGHGLTTHSSVEVIWHRNEQSSTSAGSSLQQELVTTLASAHTSAQG